MEERIADVMGCYSPAIKLWRGLTTEMRGTVEQDEDRWAIKTAPMKLVTWMARGFAADDFFL
jgi:hypothetical protein